MSTRFANSRYSSISAEVWASVRTRSPWARYVIPRSWMNGKLSTCAGPSFANAHQQVRLAHQVHALTEHSAHEELLRTQGFHADPLTPKPELSPPPGRLVVKRTRDGWFSSSPFRATHSPSKGSRTRLRTSPRFQDPLNLFSNPYIRTTWWKALRKVWNSYRKVHMSTAISHYGLRRIRTPPRLLLRVALPRSGSSWAPTPRKRTECSPHRLQTCNTLRALEVRFLQPWMALSIRRGREPSFRALKAESVTGLPLGYLPTVKSSR